MEFAILGPLEAHDRGRRVLLGGAKQRVLLGALLLHANKVVSSDRLVDELWGERPPARAAKLVQGYVFGLRKVLGADRLLTQRPGYLVHVEPDELDLVRFELLVARARGEQDPGRVVELLREALGLWRGPALADLQFEGGAGNEADVLNESRRAVLMDRIDADLLLGRHTQLVGELEALVAEHPLQERARAALMLALYRSGRQAEALDVYRATRTLLADALGLEPSRELERLQRLILTHDAELDLPGVEVPAKVSPPEAEPPPPRADRVRRTVTVVFVDLVGSTPLAEGRDPESVHRLLTRYSETCADVLEQHGGAVEKFVGDAVVAVFGMPDLHEDDALRAVRAAVDLRQAVADLSAELRRDSGVGIAVKIAVNSGEVFVGPGRRRDAFPSGDALNVAARLEQGAKKDEILLGEQTYRLVASAVRAEELEPFIVEGRTAPVRAWRLLELHTDETTYALEPTTPFVDRKLELATLEHAFARAAAARSCCVCTVVGPPGIGKSRLVRELIENLGAEATVLVGRCLSYGQGITYRPLAEMVSRLADGAPRERLAELLQDAEHADLVTERVLGAIGLGEPGGREETFWAVRRLLEAIARERALVVVFDDVHWAEPTFLDLLDYIAGFSSGAPILLLCLARTELLEERPAWAAPQSGRSLLALDPLPETDARELVDSLGVDDLDARVRARIVETAEGNPLFLEQLVAIDVLDGEPTVPPSVQAVLAARIDALDPAERALLEHAAVEGRTFHRGALARTLPERWRDDLGARLLALIHKQLIESDRPEFPGEDAFRFTHVLTRDAAYAAIPKQDRADLHEAVANWLETKPGQHGEIVAYHLEQAYRCRRELGELGAREQRLGARAAALLEAGGRTALSRSDLPAAINLLKRAVALVPESAAVAALLPELGATLTEAGELADAERVLADAVEAADELHDERLGAHALVQQALLRVQVTTDATEAASAVVQRVLPVFARTGDELGSCRARRLEAWVHWIHGRTGSAEESWHRAADHARKAGAERDEAEVLLWLASSSLFGPTPVPEGIARCEKIRPLLAGHPLEEALVLHPLGALHAMLGRFDEASNMLAQGKATEADFGVTLGASSHPEALVAMLAGDPAAAERCLRKDYDKLTSMGEKGFLSTTAALLARAVEAQGRLDEAEQLTEVARETGADDDLSTQVVWRGVRARILAQRGAAAEAERLACEAVARAAETDRLNHHADALVDLGAVFRHLERPDERNALEDALALYERKGNVVASARVGARLNEL